METKNFKQLLQPAAKFAGVLGTVGGFVGDVLSPLGPILTYLLYLSIFVLIISVVLLILLPKSKKELFKSASLTSYFLLLIFGFSVSSMKIQTMASWVII
jgi:magnesium-transporting ATPase (P-type)